MMKTHQNFQMLNKQSLARLLVHYFTLPTLLEATLPLLSVFLASLLAKQEQTVYSILTFSVLLQPLPFCTVTLRWFIPVFLHFLFILVLSTFDFLSFSGLFFQYFLYCIPYSGTSFYQSSMVSSVCISELVQYSLQPENFCCSRYPLYFSNFLFAQSGFCRFFSVVFLPLVNTSWPN